MGKRKKKAIRYNPELLIINPCDEDKPEVWRTLRKHYDIETAIEAYEEIYPESVRSVKRNEGDYDDLPFADDPQFIDGIEKHIDFHGVPPTEIKVLEVDGMEDGTVLVALGEAPAESYDAEAIIPESTKANATYVHPYGEDGHERPIKAVTSDGKTIVTLPGDHEVTDWIHGN